MKKSFENLYNLNNKIKNDNYEKLNEYINYRTQECKLNNGFNPDIENSNLIKK